MTEYRVDCIVTTEHAGGGICHTGGAAAVPPFAAPPCLCWWRCLMQPLHRPRRPARAEHSAELKQPSCMMPGDASNCDSSRHVRQSKYSIPSVQAQAGMRTEATAEQAADIIVSQQSAKQRPNCTQNTSAPVVQTEGGSCSQVIFAWPLHETSAACPVQRWPQPAWTGPG